MDEVETHNHPSAQTAAESAPGSAASAATSEKSASTVSVAAGRSSAPEGDGSPPAPTPYDVIVIGAGVSGLTAARQLLQRQPDIRLLVLEAKERVGGRTLTVPVRVAGGREEPFDLGGQWVGTPQTEIMELVHELGLTVFPQYTTGTKLMQLGGAKIRRYTSTIPNLGSLRGLLQLHLFISRIDKLAKKCSPLSKSRQRESLLRRLDGYTVDTYARKHMSNLAAIQAVDATCKVMFGCDAARMSLTHFVLDVAAAGSLGPMLEATPGSVQEFRVSGGTQQISEKLADLIGRGRLALNEPVTWIEQSGAAVRVHTVAAVYQSRCVISAVPPSQLLRIQLTPPLSAEKRCIIENMPMGNLIKFVVTYEQAFWRSAGLSGEVVSNGGPTVVAGCSSGPLCILYDATTDQGSAALVGFIAGSVARQYQQLSTADRRSAVLASLTTFFGGAAGSCVQYAEKVWAEEPFSGGCPACFTTPGLVQYHPLLRRPHGRLLFCGTELATRWTGFLSGAVQSGRRVADEALQLFA